MKKILSILLSLCIVFLNGNVCTINAAEVAHAASQAEAQSIMGSRFSGLSHTDTIYTLIGSGFTGIGDHIKTFSEGIIDKVYPQGIQKNKNVNNLMQFNFENPLVINDPKIPYTVPTEHIKAQSKKRMSGIPIDAHLVSPSKDLIIKEVIKETTRVAKDKHKVKDEPLYLPVVTKDSEELAALLEGELVGEPFLGISTTTYKILGTTIALTGIIFLILGTSGVFGSSSSSSGGSATTPGGNVNGIYGLPIIINDGNENNDQNKGSTPVIPEPSMFYLILSGLYGLHLLRRSHF